MNFADKRIDTHVKIKTPAFQFYPADWRKDPGVQSLSYHDRGVWFEILCLMHESCDRGKLMLKEGTPMPEDALSRLLGLDRQVLSNTLNTLLAYGVASREAVTGTLICRRMVRDEEAREAARIAGSTGGNPNITGGYSSPGFIYAVRDNESGHTKIGKATNYLSRIKKIEYSLGRKMEVVAVASVPNMKKSESELHELFRSKKVNDSEWFNLDDSDIRTLKGKLKGTVKGEDKGGLNPKPRASSSSSTSVISNSPKPPEGDVEGGGEIDDERAEEPDDTGKPAPPKLPPKLERILRLRPGYNPDGPKPPLKPQRDKPEANAWNRIRKSVTDDEIETLELFYAAPKAENHDETWSRKMAPAQLMNQWTTQVELATAWLDRHPGAWSGRSPGSGGGTNPHLPQKRRIIYENGMRLLLFPDGRRERLMPDEIVPGFDVDGNDISSPSSPSDGGEPV